MCGLHQVIMIHCTAATENHCFKGQRTCAWFHLWICWRSTQEWAPDTPKWIIQRDTGTVLANQKTLLQRTAWGELLGWENSGRQPCLQAWSLGISFQFVLGQSSCSCLYLAPLRALQRISQSEWSLVPGFLRSQASHGLASPTSFSPSQVFFWLVFVAAC